MWRYSVRFIIISHCHRSRLHSSDLFVEIFHQPRNVVHKKIADTHKCLVGRAFPEHCWRNESRWVVHNHWHETTGFPFLLLFFFFFISVQQPPAIWNFQTEPQTTFAQQPVNRTISSHTPVESVNVVLRSRSVDEVEVPDVTLQKVLHFVEEPPHSHRLQTVVRIKRAT